MGCGQSKTSSSSSAAAAASKTFNHRKPRFNDDLHNRQEFHFSNSPPFQDGRSAEDKANANNTTTSTTQHLAAAGGGGGGSSGNGGSASVKRGCPVAAAAAASTKRGNGADEDEVRLMDQVLMLSEEGVTSSSGHAPLDTCRLSTNPDRSTEFSQEKQARYTPSCSSSSYSSSSSSSSSSSVLVGSCRPTTRDRPSRLTSNLSNLTASQIEFFRMVDEKIAQGKEYESEDEER